MESRIAGFPGEYLWELYIVRVQLLALAAAVPEEVYGWRPVDDARSFSAVLVHIASGNLLLLHMVGAPRNGVDLYAPLAGDDLTQLAAMVHRNRSLELTLMEKQPVIDLLRQSFDAVQESFTASSVAELERTGEFLGERTTVRRVYLRMLAHSHEHMGQAIAYAKSNRVKIPWPDPLNELESALAGSGAAR